MAKHQVWHQLFHTLLVFLILGAVPVAAHADIPEGIIGEPVVVDAAAVSPLIIGCTRQNIPSINPDYEQRVVELVNDERAKVSAPPLKRNIDLDFAARYHAKDMIDDDYFAHDTRDRSGGALVHVCSMSKRVENFYIPSGGENIAAGFGFNIPASVMAGWMGSSGHKANILKTSYREIGVGYYHGGGKYFFYWVQNFGTRSNFYPLVINREYARTDNPNVSLYLYGSFSQMRFKNNDGAWSSWEGFNNNRSWRLPWRKGMQRVTVEMKNSDGTVVTNFDEIELTTGAVLGNLPMSITYVYNRSTAQLSPSPVVLSPKNTSNTDPIQWTAQPGAAWLLLSATSGETPNGQTIVQPDSSLYNAPGQFESTLTFQDKELLQAEGSPKVIPVTLVVVNSLPYQTFLPVVWR